MLSAAAALAPGHAPDLLSRRHFEALPPRQLAHAAADCLLAFPCAATAPLNSAADSHALVFSAPAGDFAACEPPPTLPTLSTFVAATFASAPEFKSPPLPLHVFPLAPARTRALPVAGRVVVAAPDVAVSTRGDVTRAVLTDCGARAVACTGAAPFAAVVVAPGCTALVTEARSAAEAPADTPPDYSEVRAGRCEHPAPAALVQPSRPPAPLASTPHCAGQAPAPAALSHAPALGPRRAPHTPFALSRASRPSHPL